jgi:hypothetical protein
MSQPARSFDKETPMSQGSAPQPAREANGVLAIVVGGVGAGVLDLVQAFILFGGKVPLTIAAGLIGGDAMRGGAAIYGLGVFLHFFIALSAAAIYYGVSRKLAFLRENPLVCGLFFGAAAHTVMQLVVLPLSALHARGPYQYSALVLGLLVHMILIGLPISFSVHHFAR